MKTLLSFRPICMLVIALLVWLPTYPQSNSGCEGCEVAEVVMSNSLVNRYRYDVGFITPLVGPDSDSFVGGSWNSTFNESFNIMSWLISLWDSATKNPSGMAVANISFQLVAASGQFWEQLNGLKVQFQYRAFL